jgi:putative transposase
MSVWWLRLGIAIERSQPGCPQDNGRHERMHLTLKKETTKPAGQNFLQQQAKFDAFIEEFNTERPHEALGMKFPAEIHTKSDKVYRGLPAVEYPLHDRTVNVTSCGRICIGKIILLPTNPLTVSSGEIAGNMKINLSQVFAGQTVGLKETDDGVWLVSFMDYDLGYFDIESRRLEPLANPFGPRLLPMSSE